MKFHIPQKNQNPHIGAGQNQTKQNPEGNDPRYWPLGHALVHKTGASVEKTIKPPEKIGRRSDWL